MAGDLVTGTLAPYYFASCCFSIVFSLLIVFAYVRFRELRQHPSAMMFWRSIFDIVFSLDMIIVQASTTAEQHCPYFSFIFQFAVLGSQAWYATIAYDLFRGLRNPFADPKANAPYYHLFVWTISLLGATILVSTSSTELRPGMELCWIRRTVGVNGMTWGVFFGPTLVIFIFSLGVIIYAMYRLRVGLEETFRVRTHVLHNGIRYTAAFLFYWAIMTVIYFQISFYEQEPDSQGSTTGPSANFGWYAAFAVGIGFRGVVDFPVWAYNHYLIRRMLLWYKISWRNIPFLCNAGDLTIASPNSSDMLLDDDLKGQDINKALRKEVMIYSTKGMLEALEKAHAYRGDDISNYFTPPPLSLYPNSLKPSYNNFNYNRNESNNTYSNHSTNNNNTSTLGTSPQCVTVLGLDDNGLRTSVANSPMNLSDRLSERNIRNKIDEVKKGSSIIHSGAGVPFIDYAPLVFLSLRRKVGISEESYQRSIRGTGGISESMIEKFTEGGRSGSFFYFTEDSKYIVKTLSKSEAQFLISFLPQYVKYMFSQPNSLLCKFVGFHQIELYKVKVFLIVMQSVFLPLGKKIHERYDLKGSTVDRHALKNGKSNKNVVMKDSDLNRVLRFSDNDRANFLQQIHNDSYFMQENNIMDYSLLLGIHFTRHRYAQSDNVADSSGIISSAFPPSPNSPSNRFHSVNSSLFQRDAGGIKAQIVEGPGIYYFGIIDILQEYDFSKRLERFFKVNFRFKSARGISCVPPLEYAIRFNEFMRQITTDDIVESSISGDVCDYTNNNNNNNINNNNNNNNNIHNIAITSSPIQSYGRRTIFDSNHIKQINENNNNNNNNMPVDFVENPIALQVNNLNNQNLTSSTNQHERISQSTEAVAVTIPHAIHSNINEDNNNNGINLDKRDTMSDDNFESNTNGSHNSGGFGGPNEIKLSKVIH